MDELLLLQDNDPSPRDEIAALLAAAILRKQLRAREPSAVGKKPSAQNKEPVQLDNSATSCLYEHTPEKRTDKRTEKTTEVVYER